MYRKDSSGGMIISLVRELNENMENAEGKKQGEHKQAVLQLEKLWENTGSVQWNWKGKEQNQSKWKLFKDNWMYVQALVCASQQ